MTRLFKLYYQLPEDTSLQMSFDFEDESEKWLGPMMTPAKDSEDALSIIYNMDRGMKAKVIGEYKGSWDKGWY